MTVSDMLDAGAGSMFGDASGDVTGDGTNNVYDKV